jgi:hypothetical protein
MYRAKAGGRKNLHRKYEDFKRSICDKTVKCKMLAWVGACEEIRKNTDGGF